MKKTKQEVEGSSKLLFRLLSVIGICFIALILITVIDNTYGETLRENALLHEQLAVQEEQLGALEDTSQQLLDELNTIIDEQEALKDKVGLEQPPAEEPETEDEGIGGPEGTTTIDEVESIQSRIDKLTQDLENLQSEFQTCEQTIVDIDEQAEINIHIPDGSPLDYLIVSSGYGYRGDPSTGYSTFHYGLDFQAPRGTTIYAAGSGTVTYAGWEGSYGYLVVINHGNGYVTMYAHCSSINVYVGQEIVKGEAIAGVGSTGRSTGNHLHFSILYNGNFVNPKTVLSVYN